MCDDTDQYLLKLENQETPTFENFVVGVNGEAVSTLRKIAQGGGPTFVYLHGKGIWTHTSASLFGASSTFSRADV